MKTLLKYRLAPSDCFEQAKPEFLTESGTAFTVRPPLYPDLSDNRLPGTHLS